MFYLLDARATVWRDGRVIDGVDVAHGQLDARTAHEPRREHERRREREAVEAGR